MGMGLHFVQLYGAQVSKAPSGVPVQEIMMLLDLHDHFPPEQSHLVRGVHVNG